MPDDTDIDALVMKARATSRELNETLASLEKAGVTVTIINPWRLQQNRESVLIANFNRVELIVCFSPGV